MTSPLSPMHIKGTKELGRRSPGSFVIQLSTINIECGTHKAQASEISRGFPSLHMFHKHEDGNHSRIAKPNWCDTCGRIVDSGEIIKGYEINKDQYVYMTEEELAAMKEGFETKTFQMLGVTKLDHKLKPEEVLDTYIVVPVAQKRKKDDEMNAMLYSLLADRLVSDGYVLIGKMFTVRGGELFGAITGESVGGTSVLYMYSLYYPYELKDPATLGLSTPALSAGAKESMGKLLEKNIKPVDYANTSSQLRDVFDKMISAKVSGTIPSPAVPSPSPSGTSSAEDALAKALAVAAYSADEQYMRGTGSEAPIEFEAPKPSKIKAVYDNGDAYAIVLKTYRKSWDNSVVHDCIWTYKHTNNVSIGDCQLGDLGKKIRYDDLPESTKVDVERLISAKEKKYSTEHLETKIMGIVIVTATLIAVAMWIKK